MKAIGLTTLLAGAGLLSALLYSCTKSPELKSPAHNTYDPLAHARASYLNINNREAVIPVQCYTKTAGKSNPCWTCHTEEQFPNLRGDVTLQWVYAFSDVGLTNQWRNLFKDRRDAMKAISDEDALKYVKEDNYSKLKNHLSKLPKNVYVGYRPDLDFDQGFDEQGFALDKSAWRAFKYKPFPGAFWPTNGNTDDVLIRLPQKFRTKDAQQNRAIYAANLSILEASFASNPQVPSAQVRWPTEPIDEKEVAYDLDADGKLGTAYFISGLPKHYLGDGRNHPVRRSIYPKGTEFLHSVRYPDPDVPTMISRRMKELRYMRKDREIDNHRIIRIYEHEEDEKDEGNLPEFAGSPLAGLLNGFGWRLQAFIEDKQGELRIQSHEETLFCMGCHSNLGVTNDQTFSFARKVPGAKGWQYQSLEDIPDVPQLGHAEPEILTYFKRVMGGDELRSNQEILKRFFKNDQVLEDKLRVAAPGGTKDIRELLFPSRERAIELIKAYMVIVAEQSFELGRDVVIAQPQNVHTKIENGTTGLREAGLSFRDGTTRLDWRRTKLWPSSTLK